MSRHLYNLFFIIVSLLLITLGVILWKAMNPEWKRYQEAVFREEKEKVTKALVQADETRRKALEKRLRYLRSPQYKIRQILLEGGRRADRCITCHLDLKQLEKKHPEIERFPFQEYGCTVCHGGVGRATEKSRAHSTLRIPSRPLYEYLEARGAKGLDRGLFDYNASGEPIPYTGSDLCLRCHLSSHPKHVARWRKLKFRPLNKVKNKLTEVQKSGLKLNASRCLGCHTTGYNERTGRYKEDRVTCESCHGPGGFYADLMAGGRARDGAQLARSNILETRAERVCLTCHKPDRHRDYEGKDMPPVLIASYLDGKPAPEIDGMALENSWKSALETKVPTWQFGYDPPRPGTDIFVRAVYNDTHIYFVFRWLDKTRNGGMGQWLYAAGGWEAKAEWPDALALDWQASEKVDDFAQGGCAVLCHSTGRFREFPRMATSREGALVDEWYWNAFTAQRAGRPGDGFLDDTIRSIPQGAAKPFFRPAHPEISAAHGSDSSGARMPETVGGIPLILTIPRFLRNGEIGRPLRLSNRDDAVGKRLPLYESGSPEGGDSADIQGRATWSDGYWTLEIGRALRTLSKRDATFAPPEKRYTFGMALWNGATGDQHQVATIVTLSFGPAKRAHRDRENIH